MRRFTFFALTVLVASSSWATEPSPQSWPLKTYLFAVVGEPGRYVLVLPGAKDTGWDGVSVHTGSLWRLRCSMPTAVRLLRDGGTKTITTTGGTLHLPVSGTASWEGKALAPAKLPFPLTLTYPARCAGAVRRG